MRKRMSCIRLLISLFAPLSLLPLEAASPDEWHGATGGGGVEYRWSAGFLGACHIEFRDSATVGTSRNTEISGVINYDRTTLDGIERNALQSFNVTIFGFASSVGPDVGCQQINEVTIRELKRFFPPANVVTANLRPQNDLTCVLWISPGCRTSVNYFFADRRPRKLQDTPSSKTYRLLIEYT